jgi:hypothetical protein
MPVAVILNQRPLPQKRMVKSDGVLVSVAESLMLLNPGEERAFRVDDENGRAAAYDVARRMNMGITTAREPDGTFLIWRTR